MGRGRRRKPSALENPSAVPGVNRIRVPRQRPPVKPVFARPTGGESVDSSVGRANPPARKSLGMFCSRKVSRSMGVEGMRGTTWRRRNSQVFGGPPVNPFQPVRADLGSGGGFPKTWRKAHPGSPARRGTKSREVSSRRASRRRGARGRGEVARQAQKLLSLRPPPVPFWHSF